MLARPPSHWSGDVQATAIMAVLNVKRLTGPDAKLEYKIIDAVSIHVHNVGGAVKCIQWSCEYSGPRRADMSPRRGSRAT